ncbi:4'-phosphopantetheinyl transferase superfamily protein [Streptomyces avidinii]|uniref:4'-phosphopantetheinyl transferase superfamily protein n=1 Tax=Streptomyces avidinii TaxID=1895 RepID=UPI0037A1CACA
MLLSLPAMARLGSAALEVPPSMVVNVLPLRVSVRPQTPLAELVTAVAADIRDLRPVGRRARSARVPRAAAGSPARTDPCVDGLGGGERDELPAPPRSARPTAFARCWTRREAVLKSTGEGLAHGARLPYVGTAAEPARTAEHQVYDLPVPPTSSSPWPSGPADGPPPLTPHVPASERRISP